MSINNPETKPPDPESDPAALVLDVLDAPPPSGSETMQDDEATTISPTPTPEASEHLSGARLALMIIALLLSLFPVVLDRTIIATALPVITSDFQDLDQAPWLGTVYLLAQAGCLPTFGQVVAILPIKWVFLAAIAVFELGSVVCGAARNMDTLIVGRAIAGLGASGIMVCCIGVIAQVSRLDQRPMVFGLISATIALGSIAGPLLGGAFTDHVSWRWCFYINLRRYPRCRVSPLELRSVAALGGFSAIWIFLLLRPSPRKSSSPPGDRSMLSKFIHLDWIGSVLFFGATACILLPLQWGGTMKPWNDKVIIILFCIGGFAWIVFLLWERYLGPKAILPLFLFGRRTIVGVAISAFILMLFIITGTYYLPLYYQSAKNMSAMRAGLEVLPFMLANVFGNAVSGVVVSRTGHPWPWLVVGPLVSTLGCGLLYWELGVVHPSLVKIGVFQFLFGFGAGIAIQQTVIMAQAEFKKEPKVVPLISAMVNGVQLFGGMVGVAIAGAIFTNKLLSGVKVYAPGLSSELTHNLIETVSIIELVPPDLKDGVLRAYSIALGDIFILGIPAGILAALGAFLIEKHNLKQPRQP